MPRESAPSRLKIGAYLAAGALATGVIGLGSAPSSQDGPRGVVVPAAMAAAGILAPAQAAAAEEAPRALVRTRAPEAAQPGQEDGVQGVQEAVAPRRCETRVKSKRA